MAEGEETGGEGEGRGVETGEQLGLAAAAAAAAWAHLWLRGGLAASCPAGLRRLLLGRGRGGNAQAGLVRGARHLLQCRPARAAAMADGREGAPSSRGAAATAHLHRRSLLPRREGNSRACFCTAKTRQT